MRCEICSRAIRALFFLLLYESKMWWINKYIISIIFWYTLFDLIYNCTLRLATVFETRLESVDFLRRNKLNITGMLRQSYEHFQTTEYFVLLFKPCCFIVPSKLFCFWSGKSGLWSLYKVYFQKFIGVQKLFRFVLKSL